MRSLVDENGCIREVNIFAGEEYRHRDEKAIEKFTNELLFQLEKKLENIRIIKRVVPEIVEEARETAEENHIPFCDAEYEGNKIFTTIIDEDLSNNGSTFDICEWLYQTDEMLYKITIPVLLTKASENDTDIHNKAGNSPICVNDKLTYTLMPMTVQIAKAITEGKRKE